MARSILRGDSARHPSSTIIQSNSPISIMWLIPVVWPGSLARFSLLANSNKPWLPSKHASRAPTKWRLQEEVLKKPYVLCSCHVKVMWFTGFILSLGIWRPYKELQASVERALYKKSPEIYHELEVALKKFKPDFISLLKNPVGVDCVFKLYDIKNDFFWKTHKSIGSKAPFMSN